MNTTQKDLGIRIQLARMEVKKQSGEKYEERIQIYIDVIEERQAFYNSSASEAVLKLFVENKPEPWAQLMFLAALGEMMLRE